MDLKVRVIIYFEFDLFLLYLLEIVLSLSVLVSLCRYRLTAVQFLYDVNVTKKTRHTVNTYHKDT